MRRRLKWMNKASEPVLDLLADSGLALPPKTILVNLDRKMDDSPGRSTVYRAFDDLLDHGMIDTVDVDGTYYVITDRGRAYLNDTLSEEELEELRESE